MHKWTLRVSDELADDYRDFCQAAGISIQSALEATVRSTVARFVENDRRPPDDWYADNPDFRAGHLRNVQLARELDAKKRSRA